MFLRLLTLVSCIGVLLMLPACQSTQIHPEAEDYRRLEQAYLNETLAENEFDLDFAAHFLGDFYPVPFIVSADRGSSVFWTTYASCNKEHGTTAAKTRLLQIIQDHGLCMFLAAMDARQYLGESQAEAILANASSSPTKLFRYLYTVPGATELFLSNSTTFIKTIAPPSPGAGTPPS